MKKIITFILILSFLGYNYSFGRLQIQVKKQTDTSYTTDLNNIKNGDNLNFKISGLLLNNNGSNDIRLSLPNGLSYSGYILNSCTNFLFKSQASNSFIFTNSGSNCIINLDYKALNMNSGVNNLSIYYNNTLTGNTASISVTNSNIIKKAISKDLNSNGYIDAYYIEFDEEITNNAINGVLINGTQANSYSGNTLSGYILFSDNIYNTQELPQIISYGQVFGNINQFGNNDITEQDGRIPILKTINSQSISGSNTIVLSNSGNIVLGFSERIQTADTSNFSLQKNGQQISGTFSINEENIFFTPNAILEAGNYTISFPSGLSDWAGNNTTIIQNINGLIVNDTTPPTNGSININGGAYSTSQNNVLLSINAIDNIGVTDMMISNNPDFSGASWENYSSSKTNWQLISGNGQKTVYIKFKDSSSNISGIYSANINLSVGNSYININTPISIYTNSNTFSLSGSCNYINNNGNIINNTIKYYISESNSGSINCDNFNWSKNFNISPNTTNEIKLWFDGSDFSSSTIKNSISIINPIPNCNSISNGVITGTYPTCDFSCNTGYTKVGNSCIANTRSFSCGSLPTNGQYNSVSSYTQTWNGNTWIPVDSTLTFSETSSINSCSFKCISGYIWDGSNCIVYNPPSSGGGLGGGGGGGGGLSFYTPTKTQVNNSNNQNPTTETIKKPEKIIKTIDSNILNYITTQTKDKSISFENVNNYLKSNTTSYKALEKTLSGIVNKINMSEIEYFSQFDDKAKIHYNSLLKNYSDLVLNTDKLIKTKDNNLKNDIKNNYNELQNLTTQINDFKLNYVSISKNGNNTVYKTTLTDIKPTLDKIENIIIKKITNLTSSKTITTKEQDSRVKAYNDFVLNLTLFKKFKSSQIKQKTLESINILNKTYSKKILTSNTKKDNIKIDTPKKVSDYYTITKDLKLGSYNDDVKSLQDILRHFGYFEYNSSSYLGPNTLESIKKFSKEVLKTDFNGIVNKSLREKILNLKY